MNTYETFTTINYNIMISKNNDLPHLDIPGYTGYKLNNL